MSELQKPPTLADVARLAGVSVPTASRALNGGVRGAQSGSAELRKRVGDAARALGYSVSTAAQAIKDGRARTVAVLVNDIDDFGSATMISGVMHAAEERGISVSVRTTRDDALRELDLLTQLVGERHRAVILATSRTTDDRREAALDRQLRILRAQGTRIVLIGDSGLDFPAVTVDNRESARLLATALVDAGHRRFAVVTAPEGQITTRDRVAGFLEGLRARGVTVDPSLIVHADFTRNGGYAAVAELEARLDGLDVIAAMSDGMAVGVIARLRELGIESPGDIEVTGFDHVPMLSDVLPNFSTVEVPLETFGEAALALALDDEVADSERIALRSTPIVHGGRLRRE
jgi:LacI family transcriptional regulator